jgi:ABC-2 type transport system permease protein
MTLLDIPTLATTRSTGRQNLTDLCRAEWLRLRSGRSSMLFFGVIVLLPLFWCYQSASSEQANWASFTAVQKASFDPVSSTLAGLYLSQVLIGVWSALVFTGEYTTHSIGTSLIGAPRRTRLFVAKCLVAAVVMFVVMELAALLSFGLGQVLLSASGPPASVGLGAPVVIHALLGTGIYAALLAVLCVSIGALVRYTAGAALVVVAITSVIYIISLVSTQFQTLVKFTPVGIFKDQISSVPADSQWGGIVIMAVVSAVAAVAACATFSKRDA